MLTFKEYIKELEQNKYIDHPNYWHCNEELNDIEQCETDTDVLDEAGNISSSLALKIQNDIIRYGRNVITAKKIESKLDYLARQNGSLSGLVLMSIAISGKKSIIGSLAKGLSLRKV